MRTSQALGESFKMDPYRESKLEAIRLDFQRMPMIGLGVINMVLVLPHVHLDTEMKGQETPFPAWYIYTVKKKKGPHSLGGGLQQKGFHEHWQGMIGGSYSYSLLPKE